jgi:ABC-type multidrug transport system fused ATPase/permease subunit
VVPVPLSSFLWVVQRRLLAVPHLLVPSVLEQQGTLFRAPIMFPFFCFVLFFLFSMFTLFGSYLGNLISSTLLFIFMCLGGAEKNVFWSEEKGLKKSWW